MVNQVLDPHNFLHDYEKLQLSLGIKYTGFLWMSFEPATMHVFVITCVLALDPVGSLYSCRNLGSAKK